MIKRKTTSFYTLLKDKAMEIPNKLYVIVFFLNGNFVGYSKISDIYWTKYPHCAQFFVDEEEARHRLLWLQKIHKHNGELTLNIKTYNVEGE